MENVDEQIIDIYDTRDGKYYRINIDDVDPQVELFPSAMKTDDILISGDDGLFNPISYIRMNDTGEILKIPLNRHIGVPITKCKLIGNSYSPIILVLLLVPNPILTKDDIVVDIYLLKY